jgi:hypothetical protein
VKTASMPSDLSRALRDVRTKFGIDQAVRCRSSTNNEDLPGFSGAGLYDSKTQHPDEGPLDKCVRQVFSSVWNLRAYLEREFYRIDHFSTAMGVLLIPNTEREQANGVAVSADPIYDEPDAYYVNAQLGENLVTNPDALVIPEELLLYGEGTLDVLSRSNLVDPGQSLLTTETIRKLRTALAIIHTRFATLYNVSADQRFAMEIEFKVTNSGELMIKHQHQAPASLRRRWLAATLQRFRGSSGRKLITASAYFDRESGRCCRFHSCRSMAVGACVGDFVSTMNNSD